MASLLAYLFLVVALSQFSYINAFTLKQPTRYINKKVPRGSTSSISPSQSTLSRGSPLHVIEIQNDAVTYAGIFAVTMIPSLIFVKFVGDSADQSRGSLSEETQSTFKKKMMQQPTLSLSIPSTEEEQLKKQIAKAYMQDKDVDVAVLEEKLRQRALWRKEVLQQKKLLSDTVSKEDDDGW